MPASHLLLAYQRGTSLSDSPSIELFIPQAEPADIMWSVPPPSREAATETHEATVVAYLPALPEALAKFIKGFPDAIIHTLPRNSPLFPTLSEDSTKLVPNAVKTDAYLLPAVHKARLTKTEDEITQIRKANEISSRAHEVVMRLLGKGVRGAIQREEGAGVQRPLLPGEWLIEKEAEAEAVFVACCRREG